METKIIHITTAKGPAECQLAAAKTLGELVSELRAKGFSVTVLDRVPGDENGTILSATVQVSGINPGAALQPWIGTIQWIQRSPYRPNHGRKNWFVGIFELKSSQVQSWNESDITYQSVRSSGAGGQHVNKVSSAVRATHRPTGISVFVQDSRSQLKNKKLAFERITEKLNQHFGKEMVERVQQQWSQHHELERGNPVKVFNGMEFKPKKPEKSYKKDRNKLKNDLKRELGSRGE